MKLHEEKQSLTSWIFLPALYLRVKKVIGVLYSSLSDKNSNSRRKGCYCFNRENFISYLI